MKTSIPSVTLLLVSLVCARASLAQTPSPAQDPSAAESESSTEVAPKTTTAPNGEDSEPTNSEPTGAKTTELDTAEAAESAQPSGEAPNEATAAEDLPESDKPKKQRRKRARRRMSTIPLSAGAGLLVGGTLPNAAPVLGFALRAGMQYKRFAFMLEGGLSGALGGSLQSGDTHSSRATLFYHGYLAPMAELRFAPLFVSLGLPLGIGMWSSTGNTVEPSGTVRSEARSTVGLVSFVGGLDLRIGRHFTVHGRHHFTFAVGSKLLFAREDEASTVVPVRGRIEGKSDRQLGVRFVPSLNVGYDYF